jgi:hypothetical protein
MCRAWEAHVSKLHDSGEAHIQFHRQEAAMWKSTAQGHERSITQVRAELAKAKQSLATFKETHLREKALNRRSVWHARRLIPSRQD